MANVLYISHTGMTESLGESQVIQYVIDLAKKNKMSILSFEKPTDLEKYEKMRRRLNEAGVAWDYYVYSNRFGLLSTTKQILVAFFFAINKIKKNHIEIVHARSLIAGVIGVFLKKTCKTKLLFDIRGFAIDEKILSGRLKEKSPLTYFLKKIEKMTYRNSDHVVTLTHTSKPIIEKNYSVIAKNISIIPTCVNENLFYAVSLSEKINLKMILGYSSNDFLILRSGSINAYYDYDTEFKLFNELVSINKKVKFLILNQDQHDLINKNLDKYPLVKENSRIISVDFSQITKYINACDMCVFFVKPSFSKKASAPTKFSELMACHINVVTNSGYGDSDFYLKNYNVGSLLNLKEVCVEPEKAARKLLELIHQYREDQTPFPSLDFDKLISEHFSKKIAIKKYQKIYDDLIVSD